MKKIFTLALSTLICTSMFAAAEFYVKVNSIGSYTVSLNNQTISSNTNTFRFFDLYPENFTLTVVQKTRGGARVVYEQAITILDAYRTVAVLDQNFNLQIIDKLAFVQNSWYVDNIITSTPVCVTPVPTTTCTPKPICGNTYTNGNNNGWNNGYSNNNNYPYNNNFPNNYPSNYPTHTNNYPNNYPYNGGNIVDDNTLSSILKTMKNATFEDKMIEVGKTALRDRYLKTNQVHQLLDVFTFEANKLEFAKFCYDKTIDKNNYYTLYNDFAFNNYSSQLDKYINSK